jgi:hypothetical protein
LVIVLFVLFSFFFWLLYCLSFFFWFLFKQYNNQKKQDKQ